MKISAQNSTLLIIDIQERLLPKINQAEEVLQTAMWCMSLAKELDIPIVLTEHFPENIGKTPEQLRNAVSEENILVKTYFSAMQDSGLGQKLNASRKQVIVLGTEAHVCVLQTVIDLLEQGYTVYLLAAGLGSRKDNDKQLALNRLEQLGAQIISREMLAFEWLEKAGTTQFKNILNKFLK